MAQFLKIAHLEREDIARVRALEDAVGLHIMAFEPGPDVASLTESQLEQVKELEEELGVTLLVYQS